MNPTAAQGNKPVYIPADALAPKRHPFIIVIVGSLLPATHAYFTYCIETPGLN